MKVRVVRTPWHSVQCDSLLLPLFQNDDLESGLVGEVDERLDGLLSELTESGEWKGKAGQVKTLHRPPGFSAGRLILAGAGPGNGGNSEALSSCVMQAVFQTGSARMNSLAVCQRRCFEPARAAQASVEGALMGTFQPDEYKTRDRRSARLEEFLFLGRGPLSTEKVEAALQRGTVLGEATNLARHLVNQPGNRLGPEQLAEKTRELGERIGLEVQILTELELQEEGMNALLAVARGSDEPARFIILQHRKGPSDSPPAVLVGKGVTFDSGGLSLKTPENMIDMKSDKAGGCVVFAAMTAVARLQLPVNVIGLIPTVENLPSGRAQRPGDVVRALGGITIEVINTDAEGRLILADALSFAQRYQPAYIVDLATLTGACMVALGQSRAGAFCNDQRLFERVETAAQHSGEKLWRLPLDPDHREQLESHIADLRNTGARWGGASIAAAFIQEFVGDVPWCHLDIAGVDVFPDNFPIKGPTGFGVRTLVALLALDLEQEA